MSTQAVGVLNQEVVVLCHPVKASWHPGGGGDGVVDGNGTVVLQAVIESDDSLAHVLTGSVPP